MRLRNITKQSDLSTMRLKCPPVHVLSWEASMKLETNDFATVILHLGKLKLGQLVDHGI